ncbi:Rho termination factor N-terminal domain-containing protein [Streptomyces lavendulocolor]
MDLIGVLGPSCAPVPRTHDPCSSPVCPGGSRTPVPNVAYSALKHTHEKVGDHWERKEGGRKGPSDPRAARPRQQGGRSGEGVDENATRQHLYEVAAGLGVTGRSRMSKQELAEAICRENRTRTRRARSS